MTAKAPFLLALAAGVALGLAPGPAGAVTDPPSTPPAQAAPAIPAAPEPYALVRTLQALQERVAEGDVDAHRAQRGLIAHIAARFAAAPPSAWADRRNAEAAIAFVLGGGPPQSLASILASGAEFGTPRTLAQGALAFLQGRETEAREAWREADPLAVGGMLGAQLALAQSALAVRDDPGESMRLLAVARLLAPGTLIEEAALRREVFVAGQSGEIERLEHLAVQYLTRFRHSIYAGNFRQRFASLLTALDFGGDLDRFARLETMLSRFDGDSRRDLYLFFARHSLVHGRSEVARRAATLAHELSAGGSDEEERATFYAAASQVTTDRFGLAADSLVDIDPERLPEPDVLLLEVVLDVAMQIGAPIALAAPEPVREIAPEIAEEDAEAAVPAAEVAEADIDTEPVADPAPAFTPPDPTPVMRRANAALAEIDLILMEARR
ncbi:chemotaxis protein MotC [Salinarimonas ramus]|uniref:Chemotaxis protein MotC n=1 Tax=Salinarimonas ramus TaxID=690164 RepID=A0A917Q6M6_9HYPH|nr:chemotaxis protein MotC [Salinarimonas ramus]GGK31041.1 hypothetical protein GCM10011322_17040 [Salinarimonas ramus]